jgi:hypothetical protein
MLYVVWAADPTRVADGTLVAMAIQIASFVACVHIAGGKSRTMLRIGSPIAWILAMCVLYFIYPSVLWCLGASFMWAGYVTPERATTLFLLHGLFMVSMTCAYAAVSRGLPTLPVAVAAPKTRTAVLLFSVPMLAVMLQRLLIGGTLLPADSYGASWAAASRGVIEARAVGGIQYVLAQVMSKLDMYGQIIQGVGAALLLSRAIATRRNRAVTLLGVACVYALTYFLSIGGRSPILISGIIALSLTDRLVGPIRWGLLLPIAAAALAAFGPLAVYRTHTEPSLAERLKATVREYSETRGDDSIGEFGPMLGKEALALDLCDSTDFTDRLYILRSVSGVVPSQLLPDKMHWLSTGDTLSVVLLGERAVRRSNAGVAGSVIADGYRTGGFWGIGLLGAMEGVLVGLVCRRLAGSPWNSGLGFFRAALVAALCSMSFLVIRSGIGELLAYMVWYVAAPLLAALACGPLFRRTRRMRPTRQVATVNRDVIVYE